MEVTGEVQQLPATVDGTRELAGVYTAEAIRIKRRGIVSGRSATQRLRANLTSVSHPRIPRQA